MKPELRHILDIEAEVGPTRELGPTPNGRRRIVPILGGTVHGPRLQAEVMPGGADWQCVRGDGVMELVARYSIKTRDGVEIAVVNRGLRRAAPETTARMARGEAVDPALVYCRATPRFEAPLPGQASPVPPDESVPEHLLLEWYNARFVKERDLKPVLTDAEGGDNEHQVLELNVKPPTGQTQILESNWTGITHSLSAGGQDLSKLRFLEIWVNDFRPYPFHTEGKGKLHINFGRVSEDAFWNPDSVPNGKLDTEDKNGDGKLDRSSDLAIDEDTGLDGVHSVNEPGYAGGGSDPNRDDYYFDPNKVPLDYSGINNLERNGTGDPNARPDTEDLNRDGFADFQDAYFEAVIDLADTSRFVAVDVTRDFAGRTGLERPVSPNNGWRLYRAPLTQEAFQPFGPASWGNVTHMRLWVNGMEGPLRLQIGGIVLLDSLGRTMPRKAIVHQNAPNPFHPGTTIRFELPEGGRVRLRVYDAHGRLVRVLAQDERPAGHYQVDWNGEDDSGRRVGSGVYWYRVELPGTQAQTRKMVLAR